MSDFITLDAMGIILQIAELAVVGVVLGAFIFLHQDIPIIPRTYWKVIIKRKQEDGSTKVVRETKGWLVKKKGGITFFRVLLKPFPSWKGVDLDKSYTKCMDESGMLPIIEHTPNINEPSNFVPENVPITQNENYLNELKDKLNLSDAGMLLVKDVQRKYSRLIDLDESGSMQDFVVTKNAQANRVAGSDLLDKLFPYIALIIIGLFLYLAYDNMSKSFSAATDRFAAIAGYYTQMTVQSCGGKFVPFEQPQNETQSPSSVIPIIGGGG